MRSGNFGHAAQFTIMIVDEAAMLGEIRLITALMTGKFKDSLRGIVLAVDHKQLDVLMTSKKFNECSDQGECSTFTRCIKGGVESLTLTENLRMHDKNLEYPNGRMYHWSLTSNPIVQRPLHREYARFIPDWLNQPSDQDVNLYMVDLKNSYTERSRVTDSRSNLASATQIIRLAKLVREHLSPADFNMKENIVVICGYKDQRKLLDRFLTELIKNHNARQRNLELQWHRSEFQEISTIDSYQGHDKPICWWDVVISHAEKPGDLGFLVDSRRCNVASIRGKMQLLIFGRMRMVTDTMLAYSTTEYKHG
jgi:AAA domain